MADNEVYAAERRLAAAVEAGTIRSMGRTWQLEPTQEFGTLAAARLFCTLTCIDAGLPPVKVRWRNGERLSHYDPKAQTIALASWGGSSVTLCHELAHHLTHVRHGRLGHGELFQRAMMELLTLTGAPNQAAYLGACLGLD